MWARILRWHPGQIISPQELPPAYSSLSNKCAETSVFVKRFIINDVKIIPISRLDNLGLNTVDRERAGKTPDIREAWDLAVSMMRGEL